MDSVHSEPVPAVPVKTEHRMKRQRIECNGYDDGMSHLEGTVPPETMQYQMVLMWLDKIGKQEIPKNPMYQNGSTVPTVPGAL